MLPEPVLQQKQETNTDGKMSDAERVAQRIAIKQAFLSSLGLEWEPDDEEVQKEYQKLPEDGSVVAMPKFEMPAPQPEPEPKKDESVFEFKPEDDVEDPLSDDEWNMILEARRAKKVGSAIAPEMNVAGNSLDNYINKPTPAPAPLAPTPAPPTQPMPVGEVIGIASNSLNNYINKPTPTPGPFPMNSPTPQPKPTFPEETTGTDEGAIV